MNINEMISEYNKIYENEDVEELYDIIPVLEGYREHLCMWIDDEPESAEQDGAQQIVDAIDIVISGIKRVNNV